MEMFNAGVPMTTQLIIDFINGNHQSRAKVLEEFQAHNDEVFALIGKEYAQGTYDRYVTARSHVQDFIKFKYKKDDLEFRELNYQFIKDYDFYLKTVRNCSNNTSLKYISNFKKIVLLAVAKKYLQKDPFKLFKGKKDKLKKKPLTQGELYSLETKKLSSVRLSLVRDIFVFQCYTGLAYIDVYQLKRENIKVGVDGELWIMSSRQKSKSKTDIPLLPRALEIMEKYHDHPICRTRGTILPVTSNQKMNEYLKEIATLCGISSTLSTHKARRTFASTVTLRNGVSINVVKEMLGHHSVKQTEDYAITEEQAVSEEMISYEPNYRQTNPQEKGQMITFMILYIT
ncbi:site-specific integrase [Chryseobacterium daeguense]|uniref:site-specific integrase n=1 Tax=Chryseobacterium daeguense TaxID=412438 RepID=UPI001E55A44D|nr:site-specific integrase [Chryseobacterium daeguense]